MAKNFTVTAGSGTTIGADEITYNATSVKAQLIKLVLGADGAYDTLVDSGQQAMANSLPVVIASDQTVVATSAKQDTMITSLQLLDDAIFAEDAASASGDKGVQILAKRLDTPANSSGTDGDYEPLQISGGLLWTRVKGMLTPNGDSMVDDTNDAVRVNLVAGSVSAGTEYTEDAAAAANPVGGMLILRRKDTLSASEVSADGDNIAANSTSKGELYVKHTDSIAVTGTFWQATQPVSAASLPLPSGAATSAKQDTVIGHLDGVEGLLTTIDGDTGTLAGAVAGSEMQVDVVAALPAGTNLLGKIAAGLDVSNLYDGSTALVPKFAKIDNASSGDNTLVAAVASKKIRVIGLFLVAAADVVVRFESGAGGTALTGQMNVYAKAGFVLPFCPVGWFETASNTLLNLELDGAVSVDGCLVYVEV